MLNTLRLPKSPLTVALAFVCLYWCNHHHHQHQSEARGGGSKRTFGSPKSQSSSNQNLADCNDQSACQADQSDSSWRSALAATMALVGPLLVLLILIVMIKFCFARAYPKGYHLREDSSQQFQEAHQEQQDKNIGAQNKSKSVVLIEMKSNQSSTD